MCKCEDSGQAMNRPCITYDNVPPCIQLGLDSSTKKNSPGHYEGEVTPLFVVSYYSSSSTISVSLQNNSTLGKGQHYTPLNNLCYGKKMKFDTNVHCQGISVVSLPQYVLKENLQSDYFAMLIDFVADISGDAGVWFKVKQQGSMLNVKVQNKVRNSVCRNIKSV